MLGKVSFYGHYGLFWVPFRRESHLWKRMPQAAILDHFAASTAEYPGLKTRPLVSGLKPCIAVQVGVRGWVERSRERFVGLLMSTLAI